MNVEQVFVLLQQVGHWNVLAISGGRHHLVDGALVLPVSYGYTVEIVLEPNDTYTVRRVFTRGGKRTVKGEVRWVYCDQVGEVAYRAHAFRTDEFGSEVPQ